MIIFITQVQTAATGVSSSHFGGNGWSPVGWRGCLSGCVIESGVQLLAALKPIKRQGWWKGKFALFWRLAAGGRGVDSCPKADSPPLTAGGPELFIGGRRGLQAEAAPPALSVILKLVLQ